ncbi:MAG: 2-(1,2-epoxy-1,2-dihydrophenyl)acetyl-CoA isomerase [Bdellovibrionales bacterium]|nr:2-(1,2-epoxy-1,2-dihydrophenyl)acetyl-CoA isomerase [Bdellovibrionales bacterium]
MSFNSIRYQVTDQVALLTLNRPEVLNSFHREMASEVQAALEDIRDNEEVRAVLLTGEGRGFCAGQDLDAVVPKDGAPQPRLGDIVRDCYNPIVSAIRTIEKPFVAAVNGVAAGAGANLAFACDLVLASDRASFIQSFVHVGLIPDTGGTYFLPKLVGLQRANALAMLGEKLSAEDAQALGLVYRVIPAEELLSEAMALATKLASLPTVGIGLTKRAFNASFSNSLEHQLSLEEELQAAAGKTEDYQEGVSAFLEKRKPQFNGQ